MLVSTTQDTRLITALPVVNDPRDGSAILALRANALIRRGQTFQALAKLQALSLSNPTADNYTNLGAVYAEMGNKDAALHYTQKACETTNAPTRSYKNLIKFLFAGDTPDLEICKNYCDLIIDAIGPKVSEAVKFEDCDEESRYDYLWALTYKAKVCELTANINGAVELLEQRIRCSEDAETRLNLGMLYQVQGDVDKMRANFNNCIEAGDRQFAAEAHYQLAKAALQDYQQDAEGDALLGAQQHIEASLENNPDAAHAYTLQRDISREMAGPETPLTDAELQQSFVLLQQLDLPLHIISDVALLMAIATSGLQNSVVAAPVVLNESALVARVEALEAELVDAQTELEGKNNLLVSSLTQANTQNTLVQALEADVQTLGQQVQNPRDQFVNHFSEVAANLGPELALSVAEQLWSTYAALIYRYDRHELAGFADYCFNRIPEQAFEGEALSAAELVILIRLPQCQELHGFESTETSGLFYQPIVEAGLTYDLGERVIRFSPTGETPEHYLPADLELINSLNYKPVCEGNTLDYDETSASQPFELAMLQYDLVIFKNNKHNKHGAKLNAKHTKHVLEVIAVESFITEHAQDPEFIPALQAELRTRMDNAALGKNSTLGKLLTVYSGQLDQSLTEIAEANAMEAASVHSAASTGNYSIGELNDVGWHAGSPATPEELSSENVAGASFQLSIS